MKFIRDNIVKILVVLGILIILIVVLVACSNFSSSGTTPTTSYGQIEKNLRERTIKYLNNHKEELLDPLEEEEVLKVQMDSVYTEKELNKITVKDENGNAVSCDGYVNVSYNIVNDSKEYKLFPHVKCGEVYETESLYEHILKNTEIVTESDGLYKMDNNYIYRGEYPDNYIVINSKTYRILGLTEDGYVRIMSYYEDSTYRNLRNVWDDRYNIDTGKYTGINDYELSRIKAYLDSFYVSQINESFTSTDRLYFSKHKLCIGKRSTSDLSISYNNECSKTIDEYISLPLMYDYYIASIDGNCKNIYDEACNNYNYMVGYGSYATPTATSDNSYKVFSSYGVEEAKRNFRMYPVFYISSDISYLSGSGTLEDPYTVTQYVE